MALQRSGQGLNLCWIRTALRIPFFSDLETTCDFRFDLIVVALLSVLQLCRGHSEGEVDSTEKMRILLSSSINFLPFRSIALKLWSHPSRAPLIRRHRK